MNECLQVTFAVQYFRDSRVGSCRVVHLSALPVVFVGARMFLEHVMSHLWLEMRQLNHCQNPSDSRFVMFQVAFGEMWKVCLHPERASIHMHHFCFN